jgi:hypothetical protein
MTCNYCRRQVGCNFKGKGNYCQGFHSGDQGMTADLSPMDEMRRDWNEKKRLINWSFHMCMHILTMRNFWSFRCFMPGARFWIWNFSIYLCELCHLILYFCNVLNLVYYVVGHVYRRVEVRRNCPRRTWHVRLWSSGCLGQTRPEQMSTALPKWINRDT